VSIAPLPLNIGVEDASTARKLPSVRLDAAEDLEAVPAEEVYATITILRR
jgi:hypothetical protein